MEWSSYLEIFIHSKLSTFSPATFISLIILFLARVLPIIVFSPFFGAKILPHPVKIGFALCLFVIMLPLLMVQVEKPLGFDLFTVFLFFKELLIGFLIGVLISIPFYMVETAGMIIDHQRGGSSLMVNDPFLKNQSSPLGTLYNQVLIFIFFYLDGPFLVLDTLAYSYEMIPPDQLLSIHFFDAKSPYWVKAMELLNVVMVTAIRLASPSLIMILMTDAFLGIINRLAPQVMITFLGMPLKSLLGMAMVPAGWHLIVTQMGIESLKWIEEIRKLIPSLRYGILE